MDAAMPGWWTTMSAVFLVVSIIMNVALVVAILLLLRTVLPLIQEVRGHVTRLGAKANDIADSAQSTVKNVQERTTQVIGATEAVTTDITRKIGAAGTAITAVFVATRVIAALRGAGVEQKKRRR